MANNNTKVWALTLTIGENVSTSIVGVYTTKKDLERGAREDLENFWHDLPNLKDDRYLSITVGELKQTTIDAAAARLVEGKPVNGRTFHWHVQELELNKNVE
jgi:hypothetical protein